MTQPAEGGLTVRLSVAGGIIESVDIRNNRVLLPPHVWAGRSAEDAVTFIARLFAVCKMAQGLAAAAAVEAAAGRRVASSHRTARRFLLLGETVLEHGSRATLDWPLLLGEAPLAAAVKALRRALVDLPADLAPQGDWMRPGGCRLVPDKKALVDRLWAVGTVLHDADALVPLDPTGWDDWLVRRQGPAARLLASLVERGEAGWGAGDLTPLPEFRMDELDARLTIDGFTAAPDWRGVVCETGPLTRRASHPLLVHLLARYGNGLLARFAARLVELALALREMQELLPALCHDHGLRLPPVTGHGVAVVEATRGRLVHRVAMIEGKVTDWRILAPTEWNFHPRGALGRGLTGMPAGDDPARRARLLVAALDPCVACDVTVEAA